MVCLCLNNKISANDIFELLSSQNLFSLLIGQMQSIHCVSADYEIK